MKFIFNTNDGIEIHFQLPVEGLSANGENQPVIGVTIRGDGGKGAAANTGKELPELCLAHTIR
jgi:hypothetical protein